MRTVLNDTVRMNRPAEPAALAGPLSSLSELAPGALGTVVRVGSGREEDPSAVERRLLELGFVHGERIEVLAEARPGRDPMVVRIGNTTLALRRSEVSTVWVEVAATAAAFGSGG
jgi:ferrous iron transport protein A